jgi:predicted DNA-binding transcriptional regulator YafY
MISTAHIELAIDAEDPIAFSYPSSTDGQLQRRVLSPYLIEGDGRILKGYDHGREEIRRYALNKIESADVLLDEDFVHPL